MMSNKAQVIDEEIKNVEHAVIRAYYRIISSTDYSHECVHGDNPRKVFALKAKELYPQWLPFLFAKLDDRLDRDFILSNHDFSHIGDDND